MQHEERDPAYLWDMLQAARSIVDFTKDLTLEGFTGLGRDKEMTRLAVERELEILGEAARRISPSFRNDHAELPWKEMIGLRNVISHEYDKVNYAEIFRIARRQIPELLALLEPLAPQPPGTEK